MIAHRSVGGLLLAALLVVIRPSVAESQVWKRVTEKARQAAAAKAREAEEKARGAVRCVIEDSACAEKAKAAGKSVVLTDSVGKVITDAKGQPGTDPKQLPQQQTGQAGTQSASGPVPGTGARLADAGDGGSAASVAPWIKDNGHAMLAGATMSGRAILQQANSRSPRIVAVLLQRCGATPDTPRAVKLWINATAPGEYEVGGPEFSSVDLAWGVNDSHRMSQATGSVRLESISNDVWIGTAKVTGPMRFSPWGFKDQPISVEVRFRATRESVTPTGQGCPSDVAKQAPATPANQVKAPPSTAVSGGAKQAAPAAPRTGTAYKPAYPFGLENLLNAIDTLPPERQKEIRRAYNDARDLWRIHDPGCLARAYMEITRDKPMSADALSSTNSYMVTANVPLHLCLDKSKVVEFVRGIGLTPDVVHAAHPLRGAYSGASAPQRRQFASCIVEGYADVFIEMSGKPGAVMKTDHVVVIAQRHFDEMATACKPHLG